MPCAAARVRFGRRPSAPARPLRIDPITVARAAVLRFEVANGVTAEDWHRVFTDERGDLQQTDRYRLVASWYALLALPPVIAPGRHAGEPVDGASSFGGGASFDAGRSFDDGPMVGAGPMVGVDQVVEASGPA